MIILTSLLIVSIGAFILMANVFFTRKPDNDLRNTLAECAVCGVGFYLSMSVQVALIASMG